MGAVHERNKSGADSGGRPGDSAPQQSTLTRHETSSRDPMKKPPTPLDLRKLRVQPLRERVSELAIDEILVNPDTTPTPLPPPLHRAVQDCARTIAAAQKRRAGVILMYGAHLIKNGAGGIVNRLMELGWVTHLATNGAGTIHDWEFSFLGRSSESVRKNVATGTFGSWDETGRNIHLALLAGGVAEEGYGRALGRFIEEEGVTLPGIDWLRASLRSEPSDPLASARADLLQAILNHQLETDRIDVHHPWKDSSVLAGAFRAGVPLTVHPGIGYDIVSNHPMFNGAVIGRAAGRDFQNFGAAVETLDGGVVLAIGSAVMAPQVFEKSISCVNNLRLQEARPIVHGHSLYVVDIQDGGNWDWSTGEPPKDNPAYYLRFCKSFARVGGALHYLQCDNVAFLHNLCHFLE
jgi:hypothetical protein